MSSLADKDFLLHSLQLNYVRHVLPNHAVQSALPGTGPHNLIAFDTSSPTLNSPYVVLSGLSDESKWPELSSGRSSPPLAPTFGREESNKAATSGRRRGATPAGATGLNYSQTIVGKGRGIGGAGMRVGGRQRSWKGRGGALEVAESDEAGTGEAEAQEVTTENLNRRNSLETSIHRKRLQDNALTLQPPPPVVIHSPVRTPQDSPVSTVDPSRANTPPTPSPEAQQRPIAVPVDLTVAAALLEDADAAERAADLQAYDAASITTPIQDDTTGSSPDVDSSLPLSHITEGSDLSTSAPLVLMHSHPSTSTSPIHSSSLQSSPSISSVPDAAETSSSLGGRYASVASSGVSLFGVSRLNGTSEGVMGRERSDSDSSSFAAGSTSNRIDAIEEDDEDNLQPPPPPPVFQPPRNFRVRERRRVNISGRMLVPISEPANEEDGPHVTISAIPHPSSAPADGPARQLSDPSLPTLAEGKPSGAPGPVLREGSPTERKRKISAPNVLLTAEPTVVESSPAVSPSTSPKPRPRPPPAPPSRHHSGIVFTKRADMPLVTPPPAPKRSALTALLTAKSESPSASNPFSQLYAALVSRASDALKLTLYFPQSKTPSKKLSVRVKKDLTVEEVIGAGLWQYWEEGREPKLDLGEEEEHDETTKWNLRIVEDDGEVDEDFPALDRTRAISAFSFDEFAIVPATGSQLKDNQSKQATIQRRPSRVLAAPKRALAVPAGNTLAPPIAPGAQPALSPTLQGAPIAPAGGSFRPGTTMGVSSALAIPVLLRVRLPPAPGVDEINTTVSVPNDMYMSDVLNHICKKRGLQNPKDWALMVQHNAADIVVPLDRTVDSLGDRHDLTLVRRSQVASLRGNSSQKRPQNTNPSASIFKRLSEPPGPKPYQSASDLTSTYKRYNVQRKLPMPLGRHGRTIAIDGDYLHFMPSTTDNKGMFEGGRTTSFHISMVHDCKVSRRAPATFKMLVTKNGHEKRYDFEAESPKQASEIVLHVKALMASFKSEDTARAGTRLQV